MILETRDSNQAESEVSCRSEFLKSECYRLIKIGSIAGGVLLPSLAVMWLIFYFELLPVFFCVAGVILIVIVICIFGWKWKWHRKIGDHLETFRKRMVRQESSIIPNEDKHPLKDEKERTGER